MHTLVPAAIKEEAEATSGAGSSSSAVDHTTHIQRVNMSNFDVDDLVSKIRDCVENRIDRNLKSVAKMMLIDLPSDESFSLDRFVGLQERHTKEQAALMASKNLEVEEAVADLLELIKRKNARVVGINHLPDLAPRQLVIGALAHPCA